MNKNTNQPGVGEESMIRHDKEGWHLDKRISLAHIFATLSFAVALASVIWALESRVTVVEQTQVTHKAVVAVEMTGVQAQLAGVRNRDKEMMLEWIRQNQEILRRLERIEDSVNTSKNNGSS
jgi:hypothetical protein